MFLERKLLARQCAMAVARAANSTAWQNLAVKSWQCVKGTGTLSGLVKVT